MRDVVQGALKWAGIGAATVLAVELWFIATIGGAIWLASGLTGMEFPSMDWGGFVLAILAVGVWVGALVGAVVGAAEGCGLLPDHPSYPPPPSIPYVPK